MLRFPRQCFDITLFSEYILLFLPDLLMCLIPRKNLTHQSTLQRKIMVIHGLMINLEALSSSLVQGSDSNTIPDSNYKDIGYQNWGHTVTITNGLLFFNSTSSDGGCKILDLSKVPWNPSVLVK